MELIHFIFSASRRVFVLAVLAGVGSGLSMVGLLALTNHVLHSAEQAPLLMMILFASLVILMVFFRIHSTVLLTRLSQHSVAELRMRLCKNILLAPLSSLEKQGSHRLLAALSDDVAAIANGITRLPFLCINTAVIVGCLLYMLMLSSWLFLVAIAFIATGITLYRFPESRALKRLTQARSYSDQLYNGFRAVCEGVKELKMHSQRREAFLSGPLHDAAQGFRENTVHAIRYYSIAGSLGLFLFFVIIGFLIFFVPQFPEMNSEMIVGYVIVFLFIQGPMEIVVTTIPELAKTAVALKKIKKIGLSLNNSSEALHHEMIKSEKFSSQDSPKIIESIHSNKIKSWQSIALKDICHSYYREQEDSHFTLGPINITFKRGEIVFLIGGNGSGKTTLAKLLLGLYAPESGHITIDNKIIHKNNLEDYRQLFSTIFVDFFLFEQLLGFEDHEVDASAQHYIDRLQLGHKVKIENGRLSTLQLSQGQKKRLALLTAYLEDRDFYLFDEWAADQDPVFKRFFYTKILPDLKAKGKTVLAITHDDQYFDIADRYIKLDSGQAIVGQKIPANIVGD